MHGVKKRKYKLIQAPEENKLYSCLVSMKLIEIACCVKIKTKPMDGYQTEAKQPGFLQ